MATLQQSVVAQLKAQIERGDYVPGDRLPPMRELVGLFSVSEITVRAVLQELARLGMVESRPRLGVYVCEPSRKLVADRSHGSKLSLACVLPAINNGFFAQILSGAEEECTRGGHRLFAVSSRGNREEERRQLRELAKEVDGLVICPLHQGFHGAYLELLDADKPFVFVDRRIDALSAPLVCSDDELGGYLATKHLIETGRRRVWFLSQPLFEISSIDGRFRGYKRALAEAGIEFDEKLVLAEAEKDDVVGYRLTTRLLQRERFDGPIGIFAVNDGIARGSYLALKEVGLGIPKDAALVSFGDTVASHLEPPLSSIDMDLAGIGARALRLLVELIDGGKEGRLAQRDLTIKLPTHLTIRSSSDMDSSFCSVRELKSFAPRHSPLVAVPVGK